MEKPFTPITIGIAGGTASGKTTFARELVSRLKTDRIIYISHDSYYKDLKDLPFEERIQQNFVHPDALETDLMIAHILKLKNGESVDIPVYSFKNYIRLPEVRHVSPQPVIIVEGMLIFAIAELREILDVKIYVDTDTDIRFMRRLKRDIEERGRTVDSVYEQYLREVRPMHEAFIEPSKRYADIIIPRGGRNKIALDLVTARIRSYLN